MKGCGKFLSNLGLGWSFVHSCAMHQMSFWGAQNIVHKSDSVVIIFCYNTLKNYNKNKILQKDNTFGWNSRNIYRFSSWFLKKASWDAYFLVTMHPCSRNPKQDIKNYAPKRYILSARLATSSKRDSKTSAILWNLKLLNSSSRVL